MRILLLVAIAAPTVASATPTTMMHQGRLLDSNGDPINGAASLDINFWDAESSGNSMWFGEADVILENGYYAVVLGSGAMPALTADLFTTDSVWLGVRVDTDAELPRTPVTSVPFALEAQSVDGGVVDASEIRVGGSVVIDGTGTFVGGNSGSVMLQGIEGTFTKCGRYDHTSAGCQEGLSFPTVCLRETAEYAAYPDHELFASDFLAPAGYWAGSEWRAMQRGSGGPCTHGTLNFAPTDPAGKATEMNLHYCGRNDGSTVGCRFPTDGWPVVCLRTDTSTEVQRGGFMVVMGHFTGGEWRGVGRGSGGPCTHGVWFWDWD